MEVSVDMKKIKMEDDPTCRFGSFSLEISLNEDGSVDYDGSVLYAGSEIILKKGAEHFISRD